MIVKLNIGIGSYGKLWTGTRLHPAHEAPKTMLWDGEKAVSNIVDALIIERTCACGASTRKFRATPVAHSPEALAALEIPECFVTAGGVGSIATDPENRLVDLTVWNWSSRVGGHAILNPLMVVSGYVDRASLPTAKDGFVWLSTYCGSTLSEYVLLPKDQLDHALPLVKLSGTCPPCRQKAEDTAKTYPPVELANDGQYALIYDGQFKAGCRVFDTKEAALAHWGGRDDDRAKMFTAALERFEVPAGSETPATEGVERPIRQPRERGERGERRSRSPRVTLAAE